MTDIADVDSNIGLMHTLFTLEDLRAFHVVEIDGEVYIKLDKSQGKVYHEMSEMLFVWLQQSKKFEAGEITKEQYDQWRYNYPSSFTEVKRLKKNKEVNNMEELEKKFHGEMVTIYQTAKKELNYNATRFLQLVSDNGGLHAAKQLIAVDGGTYGFEVLWEHDRLDLSVEALVLKPEFRQLFTDEEIILCKTRLTKYGYPFTD